MSLFLVCRLQSRPNFFLPVSLVRVLHPPDIPLLVQPLHRHRWHKKIPVPKHRGRVKIDGQLRDREEVHRPVEEG
jgi:hypothetical protein